MESLFHQRTRRLFRLTLNSVHKETMADVIGERWEDVTSCCRRIYANLTSACGLTSAAVFGDLAWEEKKKENNYFCDFLSAFSVCLKSFGHTG